MFEVGPLEGALGAHARQYRECEQKRWPRTGQSTPREDKPDNQRGGCHERGEHERWARRTGDTQHQDRVEAGYVATHAGPPRKPRAKQNPSLNAAFSSFL